MPRRSLLPFLASLAFLFALVPNAVFAQTSGLSAGFPEAPLWLSETNVTDGDAVKIYSVVYNASGGGVSGTIMFTVDEKNISTAAFTLPAGVTQIESAPWNATVGKHTFGAEITSTDATSSTALTNQKTATITVTVSPPPPPPAAVQALNTATEAANSAVTTATPVIASAANNIFSATENMRNAGATFLASQLAGGVTASAASNAVAASSKATSTPAGKVLGAETTSAAVAAAVHSGGGGFFGNIITAIERFLLVIFDSAWLFYPFFAVLLLILIWIMLKALRGRRN